MIHVPNVKHECFKNCLNGIPGLRALTMEQTKKQLRAVLLSSKEGVPMDRLEIEYFNLVFNLLFHSTFSLAILQVGESLALQARLHGFPTVCKFLTGSPDVCSLHWRGGSCVVRGVSNQETKHVAGLVSKQQGKDEGSTSHQIP